MSIIRADLQALCIAGLGIHIICSNFNDLGMISNSFTISFHNIFDERCQFFDNRRNWKRRSTKTTTLVVDCPMSDCWLKSS